MKKGLMGLAAGVLALAAAQAGAQPAYKCSTRNGVIYSEVPCVAGARDVTAPRVSRTFERNAVPPQDRAKRLQRASLPPARREECKALDARLLEEQAALAKVSQPTAADEKGLLNAKMRYRKLRC